MVTHNVDFYKNDLRFMPSNYFPFESYTIADDENDNKTILISNVKNSQRIDIPKLSRFVYY